MAIHWLRGLALVCATAMAAAVFASAARGFVKNPDGTVSAVGLLMSSSDGDDYTTSFIPVDPLLGKWSLRILQ
jgi:hypothetical protein